MVAVDFPLVVGMQNYPREARHALHIAVPLHTSCLTVPPHSIGGPVLHLISAVYPNR
jgi:hypothetical protein